MNKALLLLVFLFFTINSFTQNYLREYKTGARMWQYENGSLINYFTNTKVLQLDDGFIRDQVSGETLYKVDEKTFMDNKGNPIFTVKENSFIDSEYGDVIYLMDAEYFVEAKTNTRLFKIEGTVPVVLILALVLQKL